MKTCNLPDNPAELKGLIAEQNTVIAERDTAIAQQEVVIAQNSERISQLEEQVRLLKALYYHAKTEKAKPAQAEKQCSLFDEAELAALVHESGEEDCAETEVAMHVRKKKGRRPITPELPRVDTIHDIPEEQKVCPCGCTLSRIGEEVSEKLDIIPQKIQVIRHIRPKYACRACEGVEDEGPTVKIAPMPPQLITQGIVTPGLLAYILVNKFADGLPFYRQQKIFTRFGVDISRATMSGWALRAAKACEPLMELLHEEIRYGPIINMDETTVQVLKEPERKNASKSYMWVMRGGPVERPVVLFHYSAGRGGAVAEKLVGDFQGYLQTDGYIGYNAIGSSTAITHVGCLAHVRRKFMDVLKASSKQSKGGTAKAVVNLIGKLYHLEKRARQQELSPDEIRQLRQEKARPIMAKIKTLLMESGKRTPPKSLLGQAISYALGQWDRVIIYLQDGRLTPDNNVAENAIRPFAVGRKNWLFSGSPKGARASALLYSLIETARANGLNPYEYLLHVFEKLPYASTREDLKALLP